MRLPRLYQKGHCPAYYHLMAHLHPALPFLSPHHKDHLLSLLRRLSATFPIRIISFAIMDNHIHIFAKVPCSGCLSEEEAVRRALRLFPAGVVLSRPASYWKDQLLDISRFMKELLQRFAQWYNREEGGKGRVYMDRFRSVLVEEGVHAAVVSVYVELNPERAGLGRGYGWVSLRFRGEGWLASLEEELGMEKREYEEWLESFRERDDERKMGEWIYRGKGYFYGSEAFVCERVSSLPWRRRLRVEGRQAWA